MRSESYCGEIIIGKSSAGYTINVDPEKRVENTINGIARLIHNPNMTQEDIDYCLKVNSQRLGIDQEDLMAKVKDFMDINCEGTVSDSLKEE